VKDIFAHVAPLQFTAAMRVLIVGCGYVGLPLAVELRQAGHEVFGLRRSQAAEPELRAAGIHPVFADISIPASLRAAQQPFDWVVNCSSAGGGGPDEYRRVYLEGTQNLLSWLSNPPPQRFVYTSSTSLYGQNDGSWVTEESPTEPPTETGAILLETERLLQDAQCTTGFPAIILRLAGIYGPGRGYWFRQFRRGQAKMDGDGSRFLNMIHRDDVVGAIIAALEGGTPGRTYNVVDNEPVAQRDLFRWFAETLEQPMPPAVASAESPRKRGATNKRISNRKLREALGYSLRFPSFRQGLQSQLSQPE